MSHIPLNSGCAWVRKLQALHLNHVHQYYLCTDYYRRCMTVLQILLFWFRVALGYGVGTWRERERRSIVVRLEDI